MIFTVYSIIRDPSDASQDSRELVGETKELNEALAMVRVMEREHRSIEASYRDDDVRQEHWVVVGVQLSRKEGGDRYEFTPQHYDRDFLMNAWKDGHEEKVEVAKEKLREAGRDLDRLQAARYGLEGAEAKKHDVDIRKVMARMQAIERDVEAPCPQMPRSFKIDPWFGLVHMAEKVTAGYPPPRRQKHDEAVIEKRMVIFASDRQEFDIMAGDQGNDGEEGESQGAGMAGTAG